MNSLKQYETYLKKYPNFTLTVRNAFMSQVNTSSVQVTDIKEIHKALKAFKYKKRIKLIERFMLIKANIERYEDVIPAVNEFISSIKKKSNK